MSNVTRDTWDQVMALSSGLSLTLGPNSTDRYLFDPKRLAFFLSRYKFAAKMLKRCRSIVDVGCGDGMGTVTFLADTIAERVQGVDLDERLIGHANDVLRVTLEKGSPERAAKLRFLRHDVLAAEIPNGPFEGLASLDVIEHIEPKFEHDFLGRMAGCLVEGGVAVVGTPNEHARVYASKESEIGHINNYGPQRFQESLERHYRRVFLFSMNDEMVHTGFDKLAHYLLALCVK